VEIVDNVPAEGGALLGAVEKPNTKDDISGEYNLFVDGDALCDKK
jgi:hypothetical protein